MWKLMLINIILLILGIYYIVANVTLFRYLTTQSTHVANINLIFNLFSSLANIYSDFNRVFS